MVTPCLVGDCAPPSRSSRTPFARALVLATSLFATLPAQQPGGEGAPASQGNIPVYGRVVVEEAKLRCWPSAVATPPVFEDTLKKGDVVQLGRTENGFTEIVLPIGPIGYVARRFTEADEDGVVTTKGRVAFRYRPRTSEAPVTVLPVATTLHVVSSDGDWYKARVAGVESWLANAEVEVVPNDPENVEAYEALGARMQRDVQARLEAIAAEKKQAERDRIDLEAVATVESAFRKELEKPVEDRQFAPLEEVLAKVTENLPETGKARVAAAALQKRIETQKWIAEALPVSKSQPPESPETAEPAPPKDRLARFEAIGWLRYECDVVGPGVYYIEKGGRRQYRLTCNTGRFDLSLFVGREVGVIGPRRTPLTGELSTLDVERLEVLGGPLR